jgi:hypothetical protein
MEIWDKVKKSKFFQDLEAQEQKELLQERIEAAAIFRKAEQEEAEVMPGLVKKLSDKHEAVLKLQKETNKALEALQVAELEKMNAAARYTRLKDKQWSFLSRTASPEIDNAIQFFRDELDRLRKPGLVSIIKAGESNDLISLEKSVEWQTNKPWLLARMQYCQKTIKALETYKLQPVFDPQAMERLKNGLPDEEWTPIQSKRSLGKPAPTVYELSVATAPFLDDTVDRLLYPQKYPKHKPSVTELLNT